MTRSMTRAHWISFGILLGLFTAGSFLIADAGLDDGPKHAGRVAAATLGTLGGPFVGAIARDAQRCCLEFSAWLAVWCAPVLLLGLAAQFTAWPPAAWARLTLWILGWLVWFLGGVVSFAHALS